MAITSMIGDKMIHATSEITISIRRLKKRSPRVSPLFRLSIRMLSNRSMRSDPVMMISEIFGIL